MPEKDTCLFVHWSSFHRLIHSERSFKQFFFKLCFKLSSALQNGWMVTLTRSKAYFLFTVQPGCLKSDFASLADSCKSLMAIDISVPLCSIFPLGELGILLNSPLVSLGGQSVNRRVLSSCCCCTPEWSNQAQSATLRCLSWGRLCFQCWGETNKRHSDVGGEQRGGDAVPRLIFRLIEGSEHILRFHICNKQVCSVGPGFNLVLVKLIIQNEYVVSLVPG